MPNLRHAVISKVDDRTNTNKIYIIDLVQIGASNISYLVRRWGRRDAETFQVKATRSTNIPSTAESYALTDKKEAEGYGPDPDGMTADVIAEATLITTLRNQPELQRQAIADIGAHAGVTTSDRRSRTLGRRDSDPFEAVHRRIVAEANASRSDSWTDVFVPSPAPVVPKTRRPKATKQSKPIDPHNAPRFLDI